MHFPKQSFLVSGQNEVLDSALRCLDVEKSGISTLQESLQNDETLRRNFSEAAQMILNCAGRVIVTGMGKSGHIARKTAATLASTGTPAYFVHPAEAGHGDLGMIVPKDIILCYSWSGETSELMVILNYAKRFGIPTISITSEDKSTVSRGAQLPLVLPKAAEACPNGLAPTTSSVMLLAFSDALAIAVLEQRKFKPDDFNQFHPSGKLGSIFATVGQIMHSDVELPLARSGSSMRDALVEMTSKGFGTIGIIDDNGFLIGVITDGDLRRNMDGDIIHKSVDEVMTKTPITVQSATLAGEALRMMTEGPRKIMALFVVDQRNKPVGILHMHDLLKVGIV